MNRNQTISKMTPPEPEPDTRLTNEERLKTMSDVELACFIYMAQIQHNIATPVQWTEWLRSKTE